jgi:hypothetical protein
MKTLPKMPSLRNRYTIPHANDQKHSPAPFRSHFPHLLSATTAHSACLPQAGPRVSVEDYKRLQTAPASEVSVLLLEYQPLTAREGPP